MYKRRSQPQHSCRRNATIRTNNSTGAAGTCWNCLILPVKVLNAGGSGTLSDMIDGIMFVRNYALSNTSKKIIINLSLGRICGIGHYRGRRACEILELRKLCRFGGPGSANSQYQRRLIIRILVRNFGLISYSERYCRARLIDRSGTF